LSSSAALEVATAVIFSLLGDLNMDPVEMALLCQRAENEFVGMNCGILDQYSSIMGEAGSVLLLDCRDLSSQTRPLVPGMCGVVEDGIIPGFYGYEAGQSCVGDHFAWFVKNCAPAAYHEEARSRGLDLHELLEEKAAMQQPGEHGLLALDWWNGNRSVLVDVDLTGLVLGTTLATKGEDIYRALIEATAYGTRMIIDTFQHSGVAVDEIVACGGLPERNKLLMQIYADVSRCTIRVSASQQTPALGSAMFGAVAAGRDR
jgi:L-ribulokinase